MSGRILFGICGGIAAYKCCELVRMMVKDGFDVHCVLTSAGAKFVTPLTLQTLSGNVVHTDMFDLMREKKVNHISLARDSDIILIAPATADIIARTACGICDDLLSTVICATKSPVLFAPSMNNNMWENRITQSNVTRLREFGYNFIEPESGELACGDSGSGRLPDLEKILHAVKEILR
ncbi:MAG: Coenzyme A biosynthesis bifunctional protein CoaBC [bacterium ADurb.Bin270]|nr:MAG: Coenzyme A biosynthesis bifunctional protein CoaBC [bacterium ADurb.Bin270]HQG12817.1 flavoprotein [bacterium]HQH80533.1 flavoprotein [bacterium]